MAKKKKNNLVSNPSVSKAMAASDLDHNQLQKYTDEILADEIYWFPVRHHSPAVARYLEEAISTRKPKLILIEGPYEANDLIRYLVDKKTKPPVAIYSSYRDDDNMLGWAGIVSHSKDVAPKFACWYPMLEYSPEYLALQLGANNKIETLFMDLPHYALIPEAKTAETEKKDKPQTPEYEKLITESGFFQKLAEAGNYKSWDEAWDALFESHREERDYEAFRREMGYFCAAARATSQKDGKEWHETIQRERFMWRTIHEESQKRKIALKDIMVVCGGFHIFLDRDDKELPPSLPKGTVYTTIVPYSFFHVSELCGYGAGNRAPQYYQYIWEANKGRKFTDAIANYVVKVLTKGRQLGEALSSADAIAIVQTSNMLAALRNRREPILEDIHDALMTCCCKGDPDEEGAYLQKIIKKTDIGTKIGKVTQLLTKLPILSDFYNQIDLFGWQDAINENKVHNITLDKRDEKDAKASSFLHRLKYLKIPFVERKDTSKVFNQTLFKEEWILKWSPHVEHKVIEKNLYGDTMESAALNSLEESLQKEHCAKEICEQLLFAIDMDFPSLVHQVEQTCGDVIDTDSRFVSLSSALTSLVLLDRYAIFRHISREKLADLISRCFKRACFTLPSVVTLPEEEYEKVVQGLLALTEILQENSSKNSIEIDRDVFIEYIRQAAEGSEIAFFKGMFWGLLAELREIDAETLGNMLSLYSKEKPENMVEAGAFLDGIMSVSQTSIMFGGKHIAKAIDVLLTSCDWDTFLIMLPKMRSAFERLKENQRLNIAEIVAQNYGLMEAEQIVQLTTSVAASTIISDIDQEVAKIMQHWSFRNE